MLYKREFLNMYVKNRYQCTWAHLYFICRINSNCNIIKERPTIPNFPFKKMLQNVCKKPSNIPCVWGLRFMSKVLFLHNMLVEAALFVSKQFILKMVLKMDTLFIHKSMLEFSEIYVHLRTGQNSQTASSHFSLQSLIKMR